MISDTVIVAAIGAGGGIASTLGGLWLKYRLSRKKREAVGANIKKNDLKFHYFFESMNTWILNTIPQANFGDEGRTLIIKDYLNIFYSVSNVNFKKILKSKILKMNENEFHTLCMKTYKDSISTTEVMSKGKNIPDIFITKFNEWYSHTFTFTANCIDHICNSIYYKNNYERCNAIFNILISSYQTTLTDAEKTLRNLNGELTGIMYKNMTIEDIDIVHNNGKDFLLKLNVNKDITYINEDLSSLLGKEQISFLYTKMDKYVDINTCNEIDSIFSNSELQGIVTMKFNNDKILVGKYIKSVDVLKKVFEIVFILNDNGNKIENGTVLNIV